MLLTVLAALGCVAAPGVGYSFPFLARGGGKHAVQLPPRRAGALRRLGTALAGFHLAPCAACASLNKERDKDARTARSTCHRSRTTGPPTPSASIRITGTAVDNPARWFGRRAIRGARLHDLQVRGDEHVSRTLRGKAMTRLDTRSRFDWTSAAGAMLMHPVRQPVLVGLMLAGPGTSTANSLPRDVVIRLQLPAEQTSAGAPVMPSEPAGRAIGELRRLTGFTWDQLARLFNVNRRSLHFWASGKAMNLSNEEHLLRLLAVVRKMDRGSASTNRATLLNPRGDGSILFDLLAAGDYEGVLSSVGAGQACGPRPAKQSAEASAIRVPRAPEELIGALQDRVHPASGRLLTAKAVRAPGAK